MKAINQLLDFLDSIILDDTIATSQLCIYISLWRIWQHNHFQNPISIQREEVMLLSKINSKATYHKAMKILHNAGYINYKPTFNPFQNSQVFIIPLKKQKNHL
jgi:hypothetical protein